MTPEREKEIRDLLKGSLMYWPQTLGPWVRIALDLLAALDQELARVAKLERVAELAPAILAELEAVIDVMVRIGDLPSNVVGLKLRSEFREALAALEASDE